jgi:hypothetical protein
MGFLAGWRIGIFLGGGFFFEAFLAEGYVGQEEGHGDEAG